MSFMRICLAASHKIYYVQNHLSLLKIAGMQTLRPLLPHKKSFQTASVVLCIHYFESHPANY